MRMVFYGLNQIRCWQEDGKDLTDPKNCLLYTSDAADEEDSVDLGGRRIIKKNASKTRK